MNDIADRNDETRHDDLDALLRSVDASVENALAEDMDIEERLSRLKSAAADVPEPGDRELAEVLATWSAELLAEASRGPGTTIRAVDDPAFFSRAVGRERAGLEPWPEMQVALGDTQLQTISVAVSLPELASRNTRVTATITIGSWSGRLELRPASALNDDVEYPAVEISGSIAVPETIRLASLSGVAIELNVEGR